ncbi:MAG: DNA-processing protein DprA [Patescibacteria group bacterium]|nr:DNA-processing protein DprA [Patescibacteria group bacterium]
MFLNDYPIQEITMGGSLYPPLLKTIPNCPKKLYLRGELKQKEQCFAIVGTRKYSDYGKETAFLFGGRLARAGLTIVSGMALGIDTFSHKGALEAGGRTIAVLGTGLGEASIYPQENLNLAQHILQKGGCLISEYPENARGTNFTFPRRNRIVAGMCLGILIVEAPMGSGALITAEFAKKYRKKIFACPGSIYSQNSKGCHWLIKQGVKLAETPNDILECLGIEGAFRAGQKQGANETENRIMEVLRNGELTADKIAEKTGLPIAEISSALSVMEIEDKIKCLGRNVYAFSH